MLASSYFDTVCNGGKGKGGQWKRCVFILPIKRNSRKLFRAFVEKMLRNAFKKVRGTGGCVNVLFIGRSGIA